MTCTVLGQTHKWRSSRETWQPTSSSVIATRSGMAEFYAGCATAEDVSLARDVLTFFGCQVGASLHMDSAAARGICRREGVGKFKIVGSAIVVVTTGGQSEDTHTQNSEVAGQPC